MRRIATVHNAVPEATRTSSTTDKLGAPPVWGREEIVEYEPPHHLAYVMLSGQPVRNYRAEVDLSPTDGGTRITWRSSFDPLVPGTGGVMRMILSRIVAGLARRLAAHAGRSGS